MSFLCFLDVMPMGLFCSLYPVPGQRKGLRLIKKDVFSPKTFDIRVYNGHHNMTDKHLWEDPLASTTVDRWYMAKGVTVQEVEHSTVRGKLFLPEGTKCFSTILIIFC